MMSAAGSGAATCSRKGSPRLSRCATGGILVSQASASPIIPMGCSCGIDASAWRNVRADARESGPARAHVACKLLRLMELSGHAAGGYRIDRGYGQENLLVQIAVFVADQHAI